MPQIPSVLDMLKAGVHFGHQDNKWHPKMAPFIFTERNGVHIIDLEKTQEMLATALDFIRQAVGAGKTIMLVATKEQAQPIIKKNAEEVGVPYVTERWLGGLLTNFQEIHQSLFKKIRRLKNLRDTGEIVKYTKKEQIRIGKEIEKMDKIIGSVENMEKRPDIVFLVDVKRDKTAFEEAKTTGIKIVALCDTNANPEGVAYPIPSNDDATHAIELMVKAVAGAIKEGQADALKNVAATSTAAVPLNTATPEAKRQESRTTYVSE